MSATQPADEMRVAQQRSPAIFLTDESGTAIVLEEPAEPLVCDHTPSSDLSAIRAVAPFNEATTRKIIRQVEYYFSDQNLPTDRYLLGLLGGHGNGPVSLNRICGLKKLRSFKPPLAVKTVLRQSAVLDLLDGGKRIKRRFPLMLPILVTPEVDLEREHIEKVLGENPHLTKNMLKPTGFEEFYTDPPISPQQYEKDRKLYDPDYSFDVRIENAIRHYRSRRKMHQTTLVVFDKWMMFGGIDTSPSPYAGGNEIEGDEELDKYEIAARRFTYSVDSLILDNEDDHEVDFKTVALSFLSTEFPAYFQTSSGSVRNVCNVMVNFFNFLLHHDVCPEYAQQILAARRAVKEAEPILCKIPAADKSLQTIGGFGTACAILHSEGYTPGYSNGSLWVSKHDGELSVEDAKTIFKAGLAAFKSMELLVEIETRWADLETELVRRAELAEAQRQAESERQAEAARQAELQQQAQAAPQVEVRRQAEAKAILEARFKVDTMANASMMTTAGVDAVSNTIEVAKAEDTLLESSSSTIRPTLNLYAYREQVISIIEDNAAENPRKPVAKPEVALNPRSPFSIVASEAIGLEIAGLEKAHDHQSAIFDTVAGTIIQRMGTMRCRRWIVPGAAPEDLPADRERLPDLLDFIVEETVLESCQIGLKFEAYVCQLDIGIYWMERVERVHPNFYTWTPDLKKLKQRRREAEFFDEWLASRAHDDDAAAAPAQGTLNGHPIEPSLPQLRVTGADIEQSAV